MTKNSKRLVPIFLVILLIATGSIYALREYDRKPAGTQNMKSGFYVQANNLVTQFEAGESTATSKYADKVITIYGQVKAVSITDSTCAVFVGSRKELSSVMCQFDREYFKSINKLKPGSLVTIKGICTGYLMDVIMVRCVLELN